MDHMVNLGSNTLDFFSKEVRSARRFYLDLGQVDQGPLSVAAGGWEACSPSYVIERDGFPYYSIEFVVSGRGELILEELTYPLVRGSVFTYGPGISHRFTSDVGDPMTKYFVDLRGASALRLLTKSGLVPGTCLGVRSAARLAILWEELLGFGTHPHVLARKGAVLSLELIAVAIAQESIRSGGVGRAQATFDRSQSVLHERYLTIRSVEELAELCHLDVAYLCRLYQRFLGQTPYSILQRLKMGWAAEQLLVPGKLVREVASDLGLDPFQFSRTFKRVHGASPIEFVRLRTGQINHR
jgi:AraC-like DNA-binding protein